MRIAYSCAGEGFGHAARMAALYEDLAIRHEVRLFVPTPVTAFVRGKLPSAVLESIPCFEFVKRGNRVSYGPTILQGLRRAAHFYPTIRRLARRLRKYRIEAVLSDFEPYLPWAARLAGIPVVQMNHPGIVVRYPGLDPRSWVAALTSIAMEGPWDRRLWVSFFGGDVGPVLRPALLRRLVKNGDFLAVNLKSEGRKKLVPILDSIPGLKYRLYPAPGMDFDEGLTECAAVVTNGGHQTISEALTLGKPVLAIPQDGQYEQLLNSKMLERSGRGLWCRVPDFSKVLPRFLSRLEEFRSPKILSPEFRLRDSRWELLEALDRAFLQLSLERMTRETGIAIRSAV